MRSTAVRPHNRRLVLQLLRANGAMSRAGLKDGSGLSSAAVTNVVAELIADELVVERDPARAERSVGRPATEVALNASGAHVLGVQIGAGTLQVAVADLDANLLAHDGLTFPAKRDVHQVTADAAELLRSVMATAVIDQSQLTGIGIGAAGVVDQGQRVNVVSLNAGWKDVPLADFFEGEFRTPVVVEHNVRAMAAAEVRYGAGRGLDSLLHVYARTGVGIGLVLDSKPYRGGSVGSHEIGHFPVPGNQRPCNCGRAGCLETIVADEPVRRRLVELDVVAETDDHWVRAWRDELEADATGAAVVLDEIIDALAPAIVSTSELLNPQLVVLGGLLADLGDFLVEPLQRRIADDIVPWLSDLVRVQPSAFGDRTGLVGAATVALDSFLFGAPLLASAPTSADAETARESALMKGADRR